jgi:hypothetical protein
MCSRPREGILGRKKECFCVLSGGESILVVEEEEKLGIQRACLEEFF